MRDVLFLLTCTLQQCKEWTKCKGLFYVALTLSTLMIQAGPLGATSDTIVRTCRGCGHTGGVRLWGNRRLRCEDWC